MKSEKKYKTGYVLSGGGARGIAHIGAYKALIESGFKPDIISGTSAGAIAGAFIVNKFEPDEIFQIFSKANIFNFVHLAFSKKGFSEMSGLEKILDKYLKFKRLEDLEMPLIVCATDLNHARPKYFDHGNLIQAVIASASVPVFFNPVEIDGIFYTDGGVMNNLPLEPIEEICESLVGVNISPVIPQNEFNSMNDIAVRCFHLAVLTEIKKKTGKFDIYIVPEKLAGFNMTDIRKSMEIFNIGYEAAREVLLQHNIFKQHLIDTDSISREQY